ncbi:MAG: addiction module protein [Phycisphaerae bacterium]|nr:addiction module protein [Tepidisphaeraceae bacterium]
MSIDSDLATKVFSLPANDRAELAKQLIDSLEPESDEPDPDADRLWVEEINRRIADLDSGRAETVPWETALANVRESLRQRREGRS